jgi:hypothetical protein
MRKIFWPNKASKKRYRLVVREGGKDRLEGKPFEEWGHARASRKFWHYLIHLAPGSEFLLQRWNRASRKWEDVSGCIYRGVEQCI